MHLLAFDTETYLIQPTDAAPKPVVCSWATQDKEWLSDPWSLDTTAMFADTSNVFIGQNIPYDLVLMMRWRPSLIPFIMQALDEGRVFDMQMRERMMHLSTVGSHGYNMFPSLGDMTLKYLKLDVSADKKGDDIWRLKYGTLDGVPFEQWPTDATRYALEDARHTYDVFQAQGGLSNIQPTEQMQVQSAVVLNAIGVWGFAINQDKRKVIESALVAKITPLHAKIDGYGWTGKGSKKRLSDLVSQAWHFKHFQFIQTRAQVTGVGIDVALWQQHIPPTFNIKLIMKEAIDAGLPLPGMSFPPSIDWKMWYKETMKGMLDIPMTKKGISIAGEVLEQLGDVVKEFATYTELRHLEKMVENYIAPYKYDTAHPRFVPLVTTGRTGCRGSESAGNQQNIPRKDKDRPDEAFRTMFKARKGRVLGTVDYSQLELCTLAATIRVMFPGVTCVLGDAIDAGKDVHCVTGGLIAGRTYDQMIAGKKAKDPEVLHIRQSAKACIAKGSMVLTYNGYKPIETVTTDDLVWDGCGWAEHEGIVHKGRRTVVVESRHLALTLDHRVYYEHDKSCEYAELDEDRRNSAYSLYRIPDDKRTPTGGFIDGMGTIRSGEMFKEDVYDIVNAGPDHRFMCDGLLVANCNFGKPGGLGLGAFIGYAKNNYGVALDRSSAYKIISAWERAWPEIPNVYLKHSEQMINSSPTETFTAQTITGRDKANCIYTEGSNFPFQGLAADGAKASLWAIWKEAILGWYWSNNLGNGYGSQFRDSPLRESRIVNFVHDEIVCEHPEGDAGKAALARQESLMVSEMTRICQNKIRIGVEGNLSDAWEH